MLGLRGVTSITGYLLNTFVLKMTHSLESLSKNIIICESIDEWSVYGRLDHSELVA